MRNLTARDLGRPFISLDEQRKVLQDFLFVTDTGHGNFCFPPLSMKGKASNICKSSVYRAV